MMVPPDWVRLPVPVPSTLAVAMGYPGSARWYSMVWTPIGDEADYDDGCLSGTGDWQGFLAFINHPKVAPHLVGFDLGSSDGEATHALVVDQESQAVYVAPVRSARDVLIRQRPTREFLTDPLKGAESGAEDCLDVMTWQEVEIDPAVVESSMRRRGEVIASMLQFLDKN